MSGSSKLSGNEFQTDGSATEKVRRQTHSAGIPRYTAVRREVDDWLIVDAVTTQRRRLTESFHGRTS